MKFGKAILSICLTAMPIYAFPSSALARVCQTNSSDEFQAKQGLISLDFSMHRAPSDLAVFNAIIDKTEPLTPEIVGPLQDWIHRQSAFMKLQEQIQKANKLSTLIERHQIAWVGVEYSPSEIGSNDAMDKDGIVRFDALKATLKAANFSPETTELALIMFAGSPARFVWLRDANVRRQVQLVALDSDEIKAASQKMVLDLIPKSDTLDTALKYFGADPGKRNAIFAKLNEIAKANDDKEVPTLVATLSEVGDLIQVIRIVFADAKDLTDFITTLISEKRALNKNQRLRDTYVAKIANSQSNNGWISFGPDHTENLKKQLATVCGAKP